MALSKDQDFLRAIIMDHYDNPLKKTSSQPQNYLIYHNKSATCIDDITVYIKVENKIIEDILFSGIGCAISTSSTDIMCHQLIGKSIDIANQIIDNYLTMIQGEKQYDEEILDELIAFYRIHEQTNRIKCATIGIIAIKNCLKEL